MRILEIRLKNINSLRGEHVIRFDRSPLRESGLFGIVGATGAGKSTILDCITLALYGRVPRIGAVNSRVIEKSGVILTKHQKDCFAEVKYSCKAGNFTARWAITKTRNDTFREHEMKVFNEAGDLLNERSSQAADVNIANIGLDYDQFVKSILLCQGEFALFLKSDRNKRAELLEKITGTREFRKIGIKAFKAYSRRKRQIDVTEAAIEMNRKNLLGEDERESIMASLKEVDDNAGMLVIRLEEAKIRHAQKKRIRLTRAELEKKKAATEELTNRLNSFNQEHGSAITHYDQLLPYKENILQYGQYKKSIDEEQAQINGLEKQIKTAEEGIEKLVSDLRLWVKDEVSERDYFLHLDKFRDKVMKALSEKEQYVTDKKNSFARIRQFLDQRIFNAEKTLFRPDGSNAQLLQKLNNRSGEHRILFQQKIQGLDVEKLQQEKARLKELTQGISLLLADVKNFTLVTGKIRTGREKLELNVSRMKELVETEQRISVEFTALKGSLAAAEKEREQMMDAKNVEALRSSLKDGEPCPVCGSAHHPYVHEFAAAFVNKLDLYEQTKRACALKKEDWEKCTLEIKSLNGIIKTEEKNISDYEIELNSYKSEISQWKERLKIDEIRKEENVRELLSTYSEKLANVEWCIDYLNTEPLVRQLMEEVLGYDGSCAAFEKVESELKGMYTGNDFQQEYQFRKDDMIEKTGRRKLYKEQLLVSESRREAAKLRLKTLEADLLPGLQKLGHESIQEAAEKMISETDHRALLKEKQDLETSLSSALSLYNEEMKRLQVESAGDDDSVSLEMQEDLLKNLELETTTLKNNREKYKQRIDNDNAKLEEIGKQEGELEKLTTAIRPWDMLNKLIGDSKGNSFNTFAQELSLQQLLIFANRRMDNLHSRYALLLPEKAEDEDLRVVDRHMGDEVRSVKTLSGGETFIISLALALGLSDMASKDIRIDSLFVDEGFGSLDPETLEEAMTTLENLQSESNKMVGIISHVDSLKERIYTQIRLEKSNNGYSTMTIYPESKEHDEQAA
ncbi:MAG TPA: AAA family ATPase [Chitinophagaceae bacterium]|nr:AAA family ATPase [Chitinophagaceae bacterium]